MSDLTATNCGCNNSCGCNNNGGILGGGNSCIWIILLLVFCGGCGNGMNGILGGHNDCDCDNNNGCCDMLIWIILIFCFCGNNKGCC